MDIKRTAAGVVVVGAVLALLILAQNFLIPIVVAACIWFIINSITNIIAKLKIGGRGLPMWLCRGIALVLIVGVIFGAIEIIVASVNGMMEAAPQYQQNLEIMLTQALAAFNIDQLPSASQLTEQIDFSTIAAQAGAAVSSLAGSLFLVLFYVLFMIMEQGTFPRKWVASFGNRDSRQRAADVLDDINKSVRNYITYKTGINLATALLNLLVMWAAGLDFPIFWAFIIFIINWIPTIGSLVSVGLPTIFALVQFNTWTPIIVVFAGIMAVQTIMINILEPRLLGKLLNVSGLVVMLALVLWGSIWGIVGMILSVPIMVSLIIILSKFESTRPVAIWLSSDGQIPEAE